MGLEQARAHAVESGGQFRNFVAAPRIKGMVKISMLQGAYTLHQAGQRARECVRDQEYEAAADQNSRETQQHQQAIQIAEKLGGLIIGSQHG